MARRRSKSMKAQRAATLRHFRNLSRWLADSCARIGKAYGQHSQAIEALNRRLIAAK